MSIQSEIDRINQAKTDLAAAIESKGVTVPHNTTINVYPGLVQQIEQGAGLPTGGTPGQMLWQGESGPEWGDKPVLYVNITGSEGNYTADKTFAEIESAYQAGYAIYACCSTVENITQIVPFCGYVNMLGGAFYFGIYDGDSGSQLVIMVFSDDTVAMNTMPLSADAVTFNPGSTDLESTSVQDAIEEVNAKATPKAVSVTLTAAGWSSNSQTVTVRGVETSGQSVRISPATKTDADNWVAAGVWCSEPTTANQLVFTCDTAPTENININVELQEVQS